MPAEMAKRQNDSSAREPSECLAMDCWSEGLSEAQKAHYSKANKEYNDIMSKITDFINKENGSVLERGSDVMVLQGSGNPGVSVLNNLVTPVSQAFTVYPKSRMVLQTQAPPPLQAVSSQQLVIQGGSVPTGARVTAKTGPGNFQGANPGTVHLVMDPRNPNMLIVQAQGNQLVQSPVPQPLPTVPTSVPSIQSVQSLQTAPTTTGPPALSTWGRAPARSYLKNSPATTTTTPSSQDKGLVSSATSSSNSTSTTIHKVSKPSKNKSTISTPAAVSNPPPSNTIPTNNAKPTESNCVGGLSAGNPNRKSLSDQAREAKGPDSKEVTFNKVSGKTFPSLVVLARPHLRLREMTQAKINQERASLDSKVKSVLMYSATKFSEWLIQNGLVRGDQFCTVHTGTEGPLKLKLGMYSDVAKFPFSGGYVWVSECCPQIFVSVFSGSIFEGAPFPPAILLKLMYHWCCQTNVQNVIQWVKIDNFYVKNFFTHMRSVCVAAVHENYEKLGGPSKKVEVGVISLGTTSQDGNMRQVKVEVLGVMDAENKLIRLRAVEPFQDGERNYKRRFVKILEPLREWVHPESVILTDFTVDKGTLLDMGFKQVHQSTIPDPPSSSQKMSNQNVMEYLRRIVPRMFQNTLSLLSRQIIQQFLDELVWRERWGPVPSLAFDTLISHLAAQSKLDSGDSLIIKLGKIAGNPFRSWKYDHWKTDGIDPTPNETAPLTVPTLPPISLTPGVSLDDTASSTIAGTQQFVFALDDDTEHRVQKALKLIDASESIRKAIETYKVPRSVVLGRVAEILKPKQTEPGPGQPVFTDDEEEDIKDHLMTLYDWGYPFGRWDIRLVVKQYLDTCGRTELRFKDNFPPDMWIERYLSRHPIIRHRLCLNLPSRANAIEVDAVKQYIMNLSSVIQLVPPQNILNFMEIGLTGDPLKTMAVELRELRYPVGKRKVKSAASVMLACTAVGKVLPSYVIFEGKPVTIQGTVPGEFYATKSGWFDEIAFGHWIESVLLPWAEGLEGKKVVIGDSLAQLFTLKSLALCMDKNITFLSMPCNVSGVLSPLDIVLCDKLRMEWRAQTRLWASSHSDKYIAIEDYPFHIQELLKSTIGPDMPEQLRKAFKVIGLYPFSSKNTMKALENGGVSLEYSKQKQTASASKKRKRIYIGTVEGLKKKDAAEESPAAKEPVMDAEILQKDVDIADITEALKCSKDLIELDPYYYGTKLSSEELVKNEFKVADLSVKCPLCHHQVTDNLTLMKHILGHSSEPTNEELLHINLCRYCTKLFPTVLELDSHVSQVHTNLSSKNNVCLICAEEQESKGSLIVHMHKTHTKTELPYICTICQFRSSEQYKLVDHFYEVHAGGERIQCPYCLKCVAISNMGKKMAANTFFFMHHVKKHQALNTSRKCDKCTLWFVHKGILKEHLARDHLSCVNDSDVISYISNYEECIMMPQPKLKESLDVQISYDPDPVPSTEFYRSSIRRLVVNTNGAQCCCVECKSPFTDHFLDSMLCKHCSFSTCCSFAMDRHQRVFHTVGLNPKITQKSIKNLPEFMVCSCGYESKDGNLLASHLSVCGFGNGVAYPIVMSPPEASVQKGPPSLFNSLGLMKNSSTEEHEVDDEYTRDRSLSRASNSSSSSLKRKRSAQDADLDSCNKDTNVNRRQNDGTLRPSSRSDHVSGLVLEPPHLHNNSQPSEGISASEKLILQNIPNGNEHESGKETYQGGTSHASS